MLFRGDKGSLAIDVLRRTDLYSNDYWDGNWLEAMKNYLILSTLILISCQSAGPHKRIVAKYKDGTTRTIRSYPNRGDSLTYRIDVYFHNGNTYQIASVKEGKYVNKKTTFFENGEIHQIDSLFYPQVIGSPIWSGQTTRHYPNGNIAQFMTIKDGNMVGLFKNYSEAGKIVKEYEVVDTIKNGIYREYYTNGRILGECYYTMGVENGLEYHFNELGDTTEYGMVKNGVPVFPYKKWLKNGEILIGNYNNKEGTDVEWVWVDSLGKRLKSKIVYSAEHRFDVPLK